MNAFQPAIIEIVFDDLPDPSVSVDHSDLCEDSRMSGKLWPSDPEDYDVSRERFRTGQEGKVELSNKRMTIWML